MKKLLILIISLIFTSCGMLQSIQSHEKYLQSQFPNSKIQQLEEMSCVYVITDTLNCKSFVIEMSSFRKNKIIKINLVD